MARPTRALKFGLGGILAHKLVEDGATSLWRMSDTAGTKAFEDLNARHADARTGTRTSGVWGYSGDLPEGCLVATLDGSADGYGPPVSEWDYLGLDGDEDPRYSVFCRVWIDSTSWSAGHTKRVIWANGAEGLTLWVNSTGTLSFGSLVYSWAETTASTVNYDTWLNIVLTFNRTDGYRLYVDGSLIHGPVTNAGELHTQLITVEGPDTFDSFRIGYHSPDVSEGSFKGKVGYVACFRGTELTAAKISAYQNTLSWTDVTTHVLTDPGIEAQWGMASGAPMDRIARTGTLQFDLANGASAPHGTIGYYSPNHASMRSGFGFGIPVQFTLTNPVTGVTWHRFVGKLVGISPDPHTFGPQRTHCLAVDYMDDLARAPMGAMPIIDSYDSIQVAALALQHIAPKPHSISALSGGIETFLYGGDTSQNETTKVVQEFRRIFDSELGYAYVRGNSTRGGTLTLVNRQVRELKDTPDWTFANSMGGVEVSRHRDDVITRVRVTAHPREVSATATDTLFTLDEPVFVPKRSENEWELPTTVTFEVEYTDPNEPNARVGGKDMVTPVLNTHFTVNTASDGSGTAMDGWITLTAEFGANSATITLRNHHTGLDGYLVTLNLIGKAVRATNPVTADVSHKALSRKHGDTVLDIDQPYESSPTDARNTALWNLEAWATENTHAKLLRIVPQDGDDTLLNAAVAIDVNDLIAITETQTGMSSEKYFVNGVRTRIYSGDILETEVILTPQTAHDDWLLDTVGRSELDETTVLSL